MTTEQQRINRLAHDLADLGIDKIIKLNSRSRAPMWKRLLQGGLEPVLSAAPLVAIFAIGYFATHAVFLVIEWVML